MERTPPFGKRLKVARLRAKLSQRRLGIAAGMDEFSASGRINHYERGRHVPAYEVAERLGKVLGCSAAYFYAREEDLAELIGLFGNLSVTEKRGLIASARRGSTSRPRKK